MHENKKHSGFALTYGIVIVIFLLLSLDKNDDMAWDHWVNYGIIFIFGWTISLNIKW